MNKMLYLCSVKNLNAMFGTKETYVIAEYGAAQSGQSRDVMYLKAFGGGNITIGHGIDNALVFESYREAVNALFDLFESMVASVGEKMRDYYSKALHIEKIN